MPLNPRLYDPDAAKRKEQSAKNKRIATRGEDLACLFLQEKGWQILARNFRGGRSGEIDIVALSPEQALVFVEVKTRRIFEPEFGIEQLGFEAVNLKKQQKIKRAAALFLEQKAASRADRRFDVILVLMAEKTQLVHVESAFY